MLDSEQWSEGSSWRPSSSAGREWNGLPSVGDVELGRRRPRRARVRRSPRRDRALPLQHLHGLAAGGDRRRRRGRVRRLQPRGPLHVLRGLRAQGRAAQAARPRSSSTSAATSPSTRRRSPSYCKRQGIFLLEDCAHAHGAGWNGRRPGSFGDAGVYSFYATKTVSTGEGGVLVSSDPDLVEFARKFRNYGKFEHEVDGLNFRMSEFTAALGPWSRPSAWRRSSPGRTSTPASTSTRLHPARARAAGGDDLRPLQVRRLRRDREEHRPRLRRALPPDHGPLRRAAEHRLGGAEPLVRAALLPAREPRGAALGAEG